jgi:hypothetical protein
LELADLPFKRPAAYDVELDAAVAMALAPFSEHAQKRQQSLSLDKLADEQQAVRDV